MFIVTGIYNYRKNEHTIQSNGNIGVVTNQITTRKKIRYDHT